MMKLSDTLKQFKQIEPDPGFSARTRVEVLLAPQKEGLTVRGIFAVFHLVETGVAVALAGLFILILTGSFPGADSIAPIQYSVIDPAGLHAEAQAIDIQIQLEDINYPQVMPTASGASSVAASGALASALSKVFASKASSSTAPAAAATSTPETAGSSTASGASSTLSVDQALQALSH